MNESDRLLHAATRLATARRGYRRTLLVLALALLAEAAIAVFWFSK